MRMLWLALLVATIRITPFRVPGVQQAPLGAEWSTLRRLCLDKQLGGNDLPDAWLAAAVSHVGEHLVSFDRDFRKLLPRGQFTLLKAV